MPADFDDLWIKVGFYKRPILPMPSLILVFGPKSAVKSQKDQELQGLGPIFKV